MNSKALIEIDGGINKETVRHAKDCMIDVVVAGSYVFSGDYREKIQSLKIWSFFTSLNNKIIFY